MTPEDVLVRAAEPLRLFLPPRDRERGRSLRHDPDATVGHLVQSAGIPLPEVGQVRCDGRPVATTSRTPAGSRLDVDPVPRPEPLPAGGLLLDVHLGTLARRLRLVGLDAAYSPRAADNVDADLVERARGEDRVLLTQDRGLLMRRALRRGAFVRGHDPDDQLLDVLDRFAPDLAPLTRCTACGARLEDVAKAEVAHQLPEGTRRTYEDFARCPACGRVYWQGAHARRIREVVRRATLI